MPTMTPTTNAVFIPQIWSKEILGIVKANLVMANRVWRFDQDIAEYGNTINIPNVSALAAVAKVPGTEVTFQANTETNKVITINKYNTAPFQLEAITAIQSQYDLRSIYTDAAGYALAKAIDTDLTGLYTTVAAGNIITPVATIGDTQVIAAIAKLDAVDAPRDNRSFVIHSTTMGDLRAVSKFSQYDNTGSTGVGVGGNNGLVANVYGIDVFMSNNIGYVLGTPNVSHNLVFHQQAFALAMQKDVTVWAQQMARSLSWEIVPFVLYGVVTTRPTFAVDLGKNG